MLPVHRPRFTIMMNDGPVPTAVQTTPIGPVFVQQQGRTNLYILTHRALVIDRCYRLLRLLAVGLSAWLAHHAWAEAELRHAVHEQHQYKLISELKKRAGR